MQTFWRYRCSSIRTKGFRTRRLLVKSTFSVGELNASVRSREKQTEVGKCYRDGILVNQSRKQASRRITSLTTPANRLIELIPLAALLFYRLPGRRISLNRLCRTDKARSASRHGGISKWSPLENAARETARTGRREFLDYYEECFLE